MKLSTLPRTTVSVRERHVPSGARIRTQHASMCALNDAQTTADLVRCNEASRRDNKLMDGRVPWTFNICVAGQNIPIGDWCTMQLKVFA